MPLRVNTPFLMMIIQPTRKSAQAPKIFSPRKPFYGNAQQACCRAISITSKAWSFQSGARKLSKQVAEQSFAILTWVRLVHKVFQQVPLCNTHAVRDGRQMKADTFI
jgi:hypothetical protein